MSFINRFTTLLEPYGFRKRNNADQWYKDQSVFHLDFNDGDNYLTIKLIDNQNEPKTIIGAYNNDGGFAFIEESLSVVL